MSNRIETEGQRPILPDVAGASGRSGQLARAVGPGNEELMQRLDAVRRELNRGLLEPARQELAHLEAAVDQGGAGALLRGSLKVLSGRLQESLGDVGAARASFAAAAALFAGALTPESQEGWACRDYGIALYEGERMEEARQALERARTLGDQSFETVHHLGLLAVLDGDLATAEALLRAAVEKEPLATEAVFALAMVLDRSERAGSDAEAGELYLRAGARLMDLGRSETALEAFRDAVRLKADDPNARLALGEACRLLGRFEEAVEAVRQDSDFPFALGTKGAALHALGRNEEALEALEKALELEPAYSFALGYRGLVLRHLDRPQEAMASLEKAVAEEPDNAVWLVVLGEELLLHERYPEALEALDRAMKSSPGFALAHGTRAAVLSESGRLEEALKAAQRAVELDPEYAFGHGMRGEALRKLGRLDEALKALDRAIELDPEWALAHAWRGDVLGGLGRLEEALADLDRAVGLEDRDAFAQSRRGEVLRRLGRREEALEALNRAVELDSDDAFAHARRGDVLLGLDRREEALAALDRAVELDPGDAFAHLRRADALRLLNRLPESLAAVDHGLELEAPPEDEACALVIRGDVLRLQGRWEEALETLDRALKLQPGLASAHGMRGEVLRMLDRRQEALESLTRAVELDPGYHFAIASLGDLYRSLGKYQEARSHTERALEMSGGQYAWVVGILGIIEFETGNLEAAAKELERSVALDPAALPMAHLLRGYSLRLLGRLPEAISVLEEALRRFPDLHGARVHLGDALLVAGRGEEAARVLREAVAELEKVGQPRSQDLLYLAWSQALLGLHNEAMRTYLDALSISPAERAILFDLALTVMRSGRYELGLEEYERAVKESSLHDEPVRQRGLAVISLRELEDVVNLDNLDRHEPSLEKAIALLERFAAGETRAAAVESLAAQPG